MIFLRLYKHRTSLTCDNTPGRAGDPYYISFFKPNYSWPVIHLVDSDQGYYTYIYRYAKHNREGGRKNKRTNTDLGQLQAQERGILCDTFCAVPRSFVDYHGRVFCAKLPKKPLAMLTSVDCVLLLLLTAISNRLVSLALRCQMPSLSSLGPSFSPPLPVSREISPSVFCVDFAPKQTKR